MLEGGIKINGEEQLDFLINYLIEERNEIIDVPDDYSDKRNLFRALMNVRMPHEVSDEFLKVQDEFLTSETFIFVPLESLPRILPVVEALLLTFKLVAVTSICLIEVGLDVEFEVGISFRYFLDE